MIARPENRILWISGYCALPLALILLALLFLSGCSNIQRDPPVQVWDDMKWEGKYKPQMENEIFANHMDSRVPPDGTVARGHADDDSIYATGMDGAMYVGKSPVPMTLEEIHKGKPSSRPTARRAMIASEPGRESFRCTCPAGSLRT